MAQLNRRKVLLLSLLLFLSVSICFGALLEQDQEKPLKKKTTTQSNKNNQTKLIKPTSLSSKNQTKTIKSDNLSSKNQTKSIKPNLNISKNTKIKSTDTATALKKPSSNSTATKIKKLNKLNVTSKPVSISSKKTLDLGKASNKTTNVDQTELESKTKKKASLSWIMEEEEEEDDLVSELTDLPNKFQRTLLPDLERISTTSKAYITKANNQMTKGFKPYVGKKYAASVATVISCALIFIPLVLVSLLCTKIKAYFSLQKILIFIQVYLSIYFTILSVTSLLTGFEPLGFLYSTSQSTYLCLQVLQTLAYVFYLLLLLMYLVLVFSTDCGLASKFLGLAQVFVGFSVGLHYYVTVFHRVVLQQPPKTNWKIHAIYATCFLLVCVLARADRRKKTYVEDGGGEGKRN